MQLLKDLMSPDVKVISPDMSIGQVAKQMAEGDFAVDINEVRPTAKALTEISKPS